MAASTYLYRNVSVAGSARKFTLSAWLKRGEMALTNGSYWSSNEDSANYTQVMINDADRLEVRAQISSSYVMRKITNQLFRDPGAWYHIVVAIDTEESVANDRNKIYINGVRYTGTWDTDTDVTLNQDLSLNTTSSELRIGRDKASGYWSGDMAHVHYIDGTQYAASDFGEFDSTSGIWIAEPSPSVTYGTNGFFLKFQDTSAFGDDSSGNNNDMTMSGTITQTKDNPDNNFCTMNSLENYYANQTFTQGNNTIKSDHPAPAVGTIGLTSGKWYWEGKAIVSTSGNDWQFGINGNQVEATSDDIGNHANDYGYRGVDGDIRRNGSNNSYGDSYTAGDIIGCAVDLTNNKLYFSKNGVWQDSGDPTSGATGTGAFSIVNAAVDTPQGYFRPSAGANASANDYTWSMNFGNGYFGTTAVASANADDAGLGSFEYDVPAGYYAICTTNLGDQS